MCADLQGTDWNDKQRNLCFTYINNNYDLWKCWSEMLVELNGSALEQVSMRVLGGTSTAGWSGSRR